MDFEIKFIYQILKLSAKERREKLQCRVFTVQKIADLFLGHVYLFSGRNSQVEMFCSLKETQVTILRVFCF